MFSDSSPVGGLVGGEENGHEVNSASIKIKVMVEFVLRSKEWVEFDTKGQVLFLFVVCQAQLKLPL